MKRINVWATYLQVAPLALIFLLFLVVPIATIIVVSFFDYNTTQIIPAFLLQNYEELLLSPVTWQTYLQTLEFTVITWVLTLVIRTRAPVAGVAATPPGTPTIWPKCTTYSALPLASNLTSVGRNIMSPPTTTPVMNGCI